MALPAALLGLMSRATMGVTAASSVRAGSAAATAQQAAAEAATRRAYASKAASSHMTMEAQFAKRAGSTPLLPQERAQLAASKEAWHASNKAAMESGRYAKETRRVADALQKSTEQSERMARGATMLAGGLAIGNKAIVGLTGAVSSRFVGNLKIALDALQSAAEPIESIVRLHNPAKANQFALAMNNAQAVIGRALIPVMDAFTRSAIKLGNLFAGMEPILQPLIKATSQFIDRVIDRWLKMTMRNMPAYEMMFDALAKIVDVAASAAEALIFLAETLATIPRTVASILGYNKENSKFDPTRTAFGAAAQQARFVSAKTVSDEAIKAAMMIGAMPKESPELTELNEIAKTAQGILNWLTRKKQQVEIAATSTSPAYMTYKWMTGSRGG